MCVEPSFVVLKQAFFFFWFLTLKASVFNVFFCSFLVKKLFFLGFEHVLFMFLMFYTALFFITESQANFFRRNFLNFKATVWTIFSNQVFFSLFLMKYFFIFAAFDIQDWFRAFVYVFGKGSKKEFSSEKINILLLKKKKYEAFLKKFYRH